MWKLYNETNAQKSDVGEDLNVFFIDPVDKKVGFQTNLTELG
jgi:hypothetical protein